MMLVLQHWICLAALSCLAFGQSFEAASVKPASPGRRVWVEPTGGPGTSDPGRIHYPFVSLQFLLMKAYGVNSYQIAGPIWLDAEKFDVDATLPPGATSEQFLAMLQGLLAERFQLKTHRETKETPGYSLVIARNGPKLKESSSEALPASEGPTPLKLGADGYFEAPPRPGVFFQLASTSGARSTFRQVTMQQLAAALQKQLKCPVNDATGLSGKYDFALTYGIEGLDIGSGRIPVSRGSADALPDLFAALQEQLGLKLESKKVATEVIVIDQIEKTPKGN